jgi:NADH-quinone oxidoreductase subunit L
MPVTAVTYFLSACAIAGFPFFSGFFSKDEILWKAFDSGNMLLPGGGTVLWALAAAAALCTSFYMFRSYFMTFTGSYRGGQAAHGHDAHAASDAAHDAHAHADAHAQSGAHGAHAHVPHESPRTMTWVLAVLAVLAVVGGYIGLPHLWGLPNLFEHWLEPVFAGSGSLVHSAHRGHALEWGLMAFSVLIAFGGYLAARRFYRDQFGPKTVPARIQASPNGLVRGFYRIVFNKYYVDEAYQATFVRGTVGLSGLLAQVDREVVDGLVNLCGAAGRVVSRVQGWIDYTIVDGAVNLVGSASVRAGRAMRRVQTGRIQSYVFGLTAGAVALVVLGYMLVR